MTTLRDLLQAASDKGMSTRAMEKAVDMAAKSSGIDMRLNRGTASLILSGKYKSKPSDSTIRAIAYLAGTPESVAFAAAGQLMPTISFRDEVPAEADKLSPRRRRIALEVIRNLLEAEELEHAQQGIRLTAGMTRAEFDEAMRKAEELLPGMVEAVRVRPEDDHSATAHPLPSDEMPPWNPDRQLAAFAPEDGDIDKDREDWDNIS
ncbi:hypothetical protein [Nocardia sp. NPDC004711]